VFWPDPPATRPKPNSATGGPQRAADRLSEAAAVVPGSGSGSAPEDRSSAEAATDRVAARAVYRVAAEAADPECAYRNQRPRNANQSSGAVEQTGRPLQPPRPSLILVTPIKTRERMLWPQISGIL
jgi:hypothetical protein